MKFAKTIAAGLILLPSAMLAQDDTDLFFGQGLTVTVDLNISNLTEDVGGIIVTCQVESLYEVYGVVGEGKVFIHSEDSYPSTRLAELGIDALPITLIPLSGVFGYGGTRSYAQPVEVVVLDQDEGSNGSRLDSWIKGSCWLDIVGQEWEFEAAFDDIEGMLPVECSSGNAPLFTCTRPGTSPADAVFTFEREFGEGAADGAAAN